MLLFTLQTPYEVAKHIKKNTISDWHKFINENLNSLIKDEINDLEMEIILLKKAYFNENKTSFDSEDMLVLTNKRDMLVRTKKLYNSVQFQKEIEYHLSKMETVV